jgi:PKD repeat protein
MWGFQLKLVYDTNAPTATAFNSMAPFDTPQGPWGTIGGQISDAEGYVEMAFSYPMGELHGLTTDVPVWIATIDFSVDASGASPLHIKDSAFVDIYGNVMSHVAMSSEFRTEAGLPLAQFYWTPNGEDPVVDETLTFTSTSTDPDGYITDLLWNFGDETTGTGETVTHTYTEPGDYTVTLTVTDNDGKTDSHARTAKISPEPIEYGPVELRNSHAAYRRFSLARAHPATINQFTAWVKNLNPEQDTLVRVMWTIVTSDGIGLGEIIAEGWISPKALAQFTVDFDVLDPTWEYLGERMDYDVSVTTYYADFWVDELPHYTAGTHTGAKTNWFRITTLP